MELLILALLLALSLILLVFGLPGLWVMIASAIGYAVLVPGKIGTFTLVAVTLIAIAAEVVDFFLTGRYARKYGGSRRAGWGAIIGGVVGAMVGVPLPIIGSVVGAFVGSFAGALIAEMSLGTGHAAATRVATGALLGRVVSTALKVAVGVTIAAWIFFAAWQ